MEPATVSPLIIGRYDSPLAIIDTYTYTNAIVRVYMNR